MNGQTLASKPRIIATGLILVAASLASGHLFDGDLRIPRAIAASASYSEGFEDVGPVDPGEDGPANLIAAGWIFRNQSEPRGTKGWFGLTGGAQAGNGYLAANYESTVCGEQAVVSNWAILPPIPDQAAGDPMSFYLIGGSGARADRVQVRYSPSGGTNTGSGALDVGDFTDVLLDWQSLRFGFRAWEQQTISLPGPGRLAFRYFLPEADFCNLEGYLLGIDSLVIGTPPAGPIPFPQPGETVTWDQSISPVLIQGRQVIVAGGTVVVEPGVEIQVQADSTLVVEGTLRGAGTTASPILVTAPSVFPPALEVAGTLDLSSATITGQVRPAAGGTLLFSNVTFQGNGTVFNTTLLGRPTFIRIDQSHFNGVDLFISDSTLVLTNTSFTNASGILERGYLYIDNITVDGGSLDFGLDYQPVYIDNVSVANSTGAGLELGGSQAGNNYFLGTNVVLQNNQYPVQLGSGGLLPGSTLPATGNLNNMILVSSASDQRGPATWPDLGLPYLVAGSPSFFGKWQLLPGVTVKLGPLAIFDFEDGVLVARGRPGNPVTFERLDPTQAWNYIMVPDRLEHVIVDGSELGLIYPSQGQPARFIDSAILRNNGRAVVGGVVIRSTQFIDNTTGAVVGFTKDLNGQTNPNSFTGNTLAVETAQDATYNWWGSPSGPTTPDNPRGTGDPIASGVPFKPFRTSPPDFSDAPPQVFLNEPYFLAEAGNKIMLSWSVQENIGVTSQRILFTTQAGTVVVADNLPGSQRAFEWTVPDIGFQVSGILPVLRVVAVDTAGQEGWDEAEILIPSNDMSGTLTLTSDLTGPFTAGDEVSICWTASGLDFSASGIDGFLFLDGGRRTISLGGVHTGLNCLPLPLRMPFVSTDSARVGLRLTGSLNRVKWFFSDYFTIRPDSRVGDAAPTISLTSPAQGASFPAGSVIPIAWNATDDQGLRSFDLHASYDGGRTWHLVVEDQPGTATGFNWQTAPGSGFSDLRLRVVAHDLRFQNSSEVVAISTGGGGEPTPTPTPTPTPAPTPSPTLPPPPGNTGLLGPAANAPVTKNAGDKNGYEVNPGNAHSDDGSFALDNDSGTGTSTSCTNNRKDKHIYRDYSINLPPGATVTGIEVRLDAKVDNTSGSPKICIQLSWNGGSSWTSAKKTPVLTTGEGTYILGGPTDTWGRAWVLSEFSNANFRVRVIDVASSTARDFSLDWVAVNVHYQP